MPEIRLDIQDRIATVTLSNPGKLNAVSVAMWDALADVFTHLSADDSLRCVIVQGEGGNFAAGADIAEFPALRATAEQGRHYHRITVANALRAIAECLHPTVAAIEGACIGGGLEIACVCDIRIAAPSARFGIPIKQLGFPMAPDELRYLLPLTGKVAALEILLEGRIFSATEAKEKGLLQRIADDVPIAARQTAERIAQGAPLAARMHKQLIRRLTPQAETLTQAEWDAAFAFLDTQDYRAGVQAFLNKTQPDFSGK